MKKNSIIMLLINLIVLFVMSSCNKDESQPIGLDSIIIKTPPSKIDYYQGETLNISGLVLSLNWNNGSTEDLSYPDYKYNEILCTPANGAKLSEGMSALIITHSATGKNATQDITVKAELIDIEGNVYPFVKIGNQLWMAENLRTTKYNDGTEIPLVKDNEEWKNLNTPAYCWYDNDRVTNSDTYGALYNWYAVETGKLCPTGWHVPTHENWHELFNYLNSKNEPNTAGTLLKASSGWAEGGNGIDKYGFKALPGGRRDFYFTSDSRFSGIGYKSYWWKSEETYSLSANALSVEAAYNENFIANSSYDKKLGMSMRCVKD